jgi:hypothetical protein
MRATRFLFALFGRCPRFESLDLSRFGGQLYETSVKSHLMVKYSQHPPGVIVTIGAKSLEMALRWRAELWLNVPVVFSMVSEQTVGRLNLGPEVTGIFVRLRFQDFMTAARAVVPDLKRVALVGDSWDTQTVYGDWKTKFPRLPVLSRSST